MGGKIARVERAKKGSTRAKRLEMTIKMNVKTFISFEYVSMSLFYASQTRVYPLPRIKKKTSLSHFLSPFPFLGGREKSHRGGSRNALVK
jgi:hypothetical protein